MTIQVTCIGCGALSEKFKETGALVEIAQATGYLAFFDISSGLQCVWCCMPCSARAREAAEALRAIFGAKLQYISMTSIEHLSEPHDAACSAMFQAGQAMPVDPVRHRWWALRAAELEDLAAEQASRHKRYDVIPTFYTDAARMYVLAGRPDRIEKMMVRLWDHNDPATRALRKELQAIIDGAPLSER